MITVWNEKSFYISGYWAKNLDNYVEGVMNKNTSAVLIFDGRSGLGKTTLSSQTACYINTKVKSYMKNKAPKFSLDNMHWTPDTFVDRLQNAEKGEIIILDESMIISNRSSMSEMNRMVINMMSMIRSKQIFVIFNINSIFDMDRNLPLHRADVLVHLYAEDDKFAGRGRYMVIPSAKGKLKMLYILGKKYYDYSKARPAFIDKFTKFLPFNNDEYEKRKQKAITTYFENNDTRFKSSKLKESRDSGVRYFKKEYKLTNEEIADAFKISIRTVNRILNNN